MKKIFILLPIFWLVVLTGCSVNKNVTYEAHGNKLNTYVSITIYSNGSQKIANEALDLCDKYEKIFSRTREDSLLFLLNENGSMIAETEEEKSLLELIKTGLKYCELSQGAFDITIEPVSSLWDFAKHTIPEKQEIESALGKIDYKKIKITDNRIELNGTRLDLGAIAKGYIADRIKDFLEEQGVKSGMINLGGNILCLGQKTDGNSFNIGIKMPFDEQKVVAGVRVKDKSVVTSGNYERYFYENDILYHHILDVKTGYPCNNNINSVTIISDKSVEGDCLSTCCFVLGLDKGMELLNSIDDVCGLFVDGNGQIHYSDGIKEYISK